MRIVLLLVVVLLAGCGYHTPGSSDTWVGGDARILYVQLFENRTAEPYLDNYLTSALINELSRSRLVVITEDQTQADVRLVGEIKDFNSDALAYNNKDQITDYRATMRVAARLLRKDSTEALWQTDLQRSEDFIATANKNLQRAGESLAASQISQRLAEDIYAGLLNGF